MSLEVTGQLIAKYDTQVVSDKFKKREFVIEISDEVNGKVYNNPAKFQLTQAKCDILDKYNIMDYVKVSFNIKGNQWEKDGKVNFITNLECWRLETVSGHNQPPVHHHAPNMQNSTAVDDSQLPF